MNKDILVYYCHNTDKRKITTNKLVVTNISIIKIPEHISIRILRNMTTYEGMIYPYSFDYVVFPGVDKKIYQIVYNMLLPSVNYALALSYVEYKIEAIRNIAIGIIKHKAFKKKNFDPWYYADTHGYLCLRP